MKAAAKDAKAMWWDDVHLARSQPVSVPAGRRSGSARATSGSPRARVSARAVWSDLEPGCGACGATGPGVRLGGVRTARRLARRI